MSTTVKLLCQREDCLKYFINPWNSKGNTLEKVIAWAGFFFAGWIYYPINAVYRVFEWLICGGKVNTAVFADNIAKGLADFDNPEVSGKVHGIYIMTNETHLEKIRETFLEHPRPDEKTPTIHIGCAAWHNLDIICARRSSYGLIVDFNPKNAEFIRKTIELVNACESREIFKNTMIEYLNSLVGNQRGVFFHSDQKKSPTEKIELELTREGSWLASEENYLYIKQLVGRIVAITEDIRNTETISSVREFLDSHQIAIDTVYMSNVCNFMKTSEDKNSFAESIRQLLQEDTIFINCPTVNSTILIQDSLLGSEVLKDSFEKTRLFER